MDAPNLQENFIDDILSPSNTARKYRLINNADGTISLEDVTVYSQIGSSYGAKQLNEANSAINALYNEILSDPNTIYNANDNIIQAKKIGNIVFARMTIYMPDTTERMLTIVGDWKPINGFYVPLVRNGQLSAKSWLTVQGDRTALTYAAANNNYGTYTANTFWFTSS